MASDELDLNKFPLLKSSNYLEWSRLMQALLMRIHAWKLVTRRELRPTDQEEAKDWEKRAEKAAGEIFLRLDSANRDAVVDDLGEAAEAP